MKEVGKEHTPPYARYLGRLSGHFPNFDFFFIKSVRQKAVELLNLKHGKRVLDAGCGSGGSFPYLVRAVGATGKVLGIEISPESTLSARRRIAKNDWGNVRVVESAAQTVVLTDMFDGLLMFAAPDVYASEEALDNIIPHLRENARVAVFGAKLSNHRLGRILNPILKMLVKSSFSTTPKPEYESWRVLSNYVEEIEVEEYFFGLMFLAAGSVARR